MRRRTRRWLRRLGLALLAVVALLFLFGPYERVEGDLRFDHSLLKGGVEPYIAARESQFDDIRPGERMRVHWHGLEEVPTDFAILYVHGFSAGTEELRPVPDRVAEALRANLVFARLRGHGRDGAALAEVRAGDWIADMAESLAIARSVGQEVIVIATSTGATLTALAATDPAAMRDVKGVVLISPNFELQSSMAALLRLPAARYWLPLVAGRRFAFEPQNARQAQHWTTTYPVTALLPMAALVRHVAALDFGSVTVPALFYYSDDDQVVDADATDDVAAAWGGPVTRAAPQLGDGMDPLAHVIAGDILSPAGTGAAVNLILDWVAELP